MALTKKTKVRAAAPVVEEAGKVDAYLASLPEPARATLTEMRRMIREAAPAEATEKISYGMPTFQYKGGLVGYAAFPKHCGFYPMNPEVISQLSLELLQYPTSKGTIRFPLDTPLPQALVRKMVKLRARENEKKR